MVAVGMNYLLGAGDAVLPIHRDVRPCHGESPYEAWSVSVSCRASIKIPATAQQGQGKKAHKKSGLRRNASQLTLTGVFLDGHLAGWFLTTLGTLRVLRRGGSTKWRDGANKAANCLGKVPAESRLGMTSRLTMASLAVWKLLRCGSTWTWAAISRIPRRRSV
jgi:hypothetical protein